MKNYYRDVPVPEDMDDPAFISSRCIDTANWNGTKHRKKFKNYQGFTGFYGNTSYPQASFDILEDSRASILCTSITPLEQQAISGKPMWIFRILPFSARFINRLFVTKLTIKRQKAAFRRSSFEEFKGELKYLETQRETMAKSPRPIHLITNHEDLVRTMQQHKIALVLSLEGGHILYGRANEKDYSWFQCRKNPDSCFREIMDHIRWIKQQPYHPFFITISHLTWNRMAGYAKGFDSDKPFIRKLLDANSGSRKFRERIFNKQSVGIVDTLYNFPTSATTPDHCICNFSVNPYFKGRGYEIIRALLDTANGKRILIDMRHMDVQARMEYIGLVEELNKKGANIPLIVSHAAVNGKDSNQARVYGSCPIVDQYGELIQPEKYYTAHNDCVKKPVDLNSVGWFHPWSINLFNEEIDAVYRSNGIIGVTLEERVLGTGRPNYTPDHKKDMEAFLITNGFIHPEDIDTFRIAEPLMRNILYIVEHSGYARSLASWEHIAIGSDFDGIINPIDICTKASDIPNLYRILTRDLPVFARYLQKQDLLCNTRIEILLNRLFYLNGETFILNNFPN